MPNTEFTIKAQAIAAVRQLIVAITTAAVIVGALIFGFAGQTAAEAKVREDTLHATLATACVLSLPVDPEMGRDPTAVQLCFTQYDLEAPSFPEERP